MRNFSRVRTTLLVACRQESDARELSLRIAGADPAIVAASTDLARVLAGAARLQPDVLLLEYAVEQHDGLREMPWRLQRNELAARTIVLGAARPPDVVLDFIRHNASGWLLRSASPELQAKAVRAVHHGDTWFTREELMHVLRSDFGPAPPAAGAIDGQESLTQRESQILTLVGTGRTNKEIGRELRISDQTVKTHLHNIYVKLNRSGRYKALLSHVSLHGAAAESPGSPGL